MKVERRESGGVRKRVAASEGRLVWAGPNLAVREVFQRVGFDLVFDAQPDVSRAGGVSAGG